MLKENKKTNERYSLSSKSEKRFLVNFQTKNAIIPINATPPATESPTIEPVPSPELSSLLFAAALEVDEGAAEVDAPGLVRVVMTSLPLMTVVTIGCWDVKSGGGVDAAFVVVVEVGVVDVFD